MKNALISISQIDIPADVERDTLRVDDDLLAKSIAHGGIQQPLIVLAGHKGRYTLIDGLRRVRAAELIKLPKVPVLVDEVPKLSLIHI
jgi:ParB/RepB/Spo0J family partition protein